MFAALLTALCFALVGVCANRSARLLGSLRANVWRLLVAVMLLGFWALVYGRGWHGPASEWFFLSGLLGFGIGGVAMFHSLPRLGTPLSLLVVECSTAVFALVIEWGWLGTTVLASQLGFMALVLVGVVVGLAPGFPSDIGEKRKISGLGWALVSGFGQALGMVVSRHAWALTKSADFELDPGTAAWQRLIGGLTVGALVYALVKLWPTLLPRSEMPEVEKARDRGLGTWGPDWPWLWVLLNATFGPVLGITARQWALSLAPAGLVQTVVSTAPLMATPLARLMEGRWPRRRFFVGAALAIVGLAGLFIG
ncbi:DMT family transporter [Synoicihabitans lomoniglobus]|uniref:DMT family transporter n=1 Tax=Synoicihabitans lomoniglobus TaxID=2909285 RepID=A0AAF0CR78_9BACT|nr:DMT family transporter [Opitutaceae bacterium LMO-M01]